MITIVQPPDKRSTGRSPRLSEEDIQDLAEGLKAAFVALKDGKVPHWLTDNEPVGTKSAAYQRAQSARDLVFKALGDEYKIEDIKTAVEPVDNDDESKGYVWKIGPRPVGERPRRRPQKKAS